MQYRINRTDDGGWSIDVWQRGHAVLSDSLLNKGTAFTQHERTAFELEGMLPHQTCDRERQVRRAREHIRAKGDNALERYIGMSALQDRNETLFYQVLAAHLEDLIPIVYTPTVGQAATRFSHIFRRGRGLWITPGHQGRIFDVLGHVRNEEVRLIVATDNERILGLGDQGAGGMVIPIGKLALYTVAAGIHPAYTLPISLDVGTDNPDLLADELYAGWPEPRLRGDAYDALIDEFVTAVRDRFPDSLLQWEDFKKANAFRLLDRYRTLLPSFNDDIQGTAAVVVAGLITAARALETTLSDQRIMLVGAGAAGVGIARQLRHTLADRGVQADDLDRAVAVVDTSGLVVDGRAGLERYKRSVAWPAPLPGALGLGPSSSLVDIVDRLRPTVLIGTTGQRGLFAEPLIGALARHVERPIVMALSNPTDKCEAEPADIVAWSAGRALVATGSPFDSVMYRGRSIPVSQCNNVYVFPGVGLGAIVAGANRITDSMFGAAADELATLVTDEDISRGMLYPPIRDLRRITRRIAHAVARAASGRVGSDQRSDEEIEAELDRQIWDLDYPALNAV